MRLEDRLQDLFNKEAKLDNLKKLYELNNINIYTHIEKYPNSTICKKILSNKYNWTEEDDNLIKPYFSGFKKDKRTYRDYAFNVLTGWLTEDVVLMSLNCNDDNFKINGCDYSRNVLEHRTISNSPDFVSTKEPKIYLELQTNYQKNQEQCFWEINKKIDLRNNKLPNMIELSKTNSVFLVGLIVAKSRFFIIPISTKTQFHTEENNHFFGGKKTRYIKLDDRIMYHRLNKISTMFWSKL